MTDLYSIRLIEVLRDRDARGAAMAEYGLLLTFVALAVVAILTTFGGTLSDFFGFAAETFENAPGGSGSGS